MREVTYYINDHEYMRELYKDAPNLEDILSGLPDPFICVYTLKGQIIPGQQVTEYNHYELTDVVGRKIDTDSLNGYQRGVVLCDCQRHFAGKCDKPFGVVGIKEVLEE